jgi:flavin-dependent dehydrogenase
MGYTFNIPIPMPHTNLSQFSEQDIIIVGSGPAGISTALHLAIMAPELIPRTLILEKARHPRHKVCGGGLLPDAERLLAELGLDVTEIPHVDVDWAHFNFAGRGMRMRAEKNGLYAFRTIRRHEFDAWLASRAREKGFRILEDTAVRSIAVSESGVLVTTDRGDFSAEVVVGADGSNSLVRRAIIPREELHVARLLEVVTEPSAENTFSNPDNSSFDFSVLMQGIQGYVWDFPALEQGKPVRVRGIYDANILAVKNRLPLRAGLEADLVRYGINLSEYDLEGHPLRWFDARQAFAALRLLLVGDAAGTDALFGEGISFALGYGRIAARAIQEAFSSRDFSFRDYKRSLLQTAMGRALRRRTWFAKFFYRLRFAPFQVFLWRKMGWFIAWAMRTFFIGWARRQEHSTGKKG